MFGIAVYFNWTPWTVHFAFNIRFYPALIQNAFTMKSMMHTARNLNEIFMLHKM